MCTATEYIIVENFYLNIHILHDDKFILKDTTSKKLKTRVLWSLKRTPELQYIKCKSFPHICNQLCAHDSLFF